MGRAYSPLEAGLVFAALPTIGNFGGIETNNKGNQRIEWT
ncbi:hypothetical protein NEISICOT_01388 [Neisseria sicca ATCC 29256]|uniref:Uncharacterized protein n=1 Tax=Neisseria sicca ATCC 29256 TaxID=547045 RepID=C6M4E2_NEISI|nr:hypothetical protein NEISICOT_01388 [Neisseria sicca ATCC 29256]